VDSRYPEAQGGKGDYWFKPVRIEWELMNKGRKSDRGNKNGSPSKQRNNESKKGVNLRRITPMKGLTKKNQKEEERGGFTKRSWEENWGKNPDHALRKDGGQ